MLAQEPETEKKKPTVKDYEEYYQHYKNWSENLSNEKFWKDMTLKHKETGKIVKFIDLPAYEKSIFYFMSGQKLTKELATLHNFWKKELDNFGKEPEKLDEPEIASKANVEKYLTKLLKLRKDTAVRFEALASKFFKEYKHKFTDEEQQKYIKEIQEYHDKDNLIDRKAK